MKGTTEMKAGLWIVGALAGVALSPALTHAGDEWEYRVTPYLWLPTMHTDLQIGDNPSASSDTSILDVLNYGFLANFEVRKGNWGFLGEFNYLNVSQDASWGNGLFDADMTAKGVMAGAALDYRFARFDRGSIDAFAGARVWSLDAKIDFDRLPSVSRSKTLVDPLIGVRAHFDLTDRIFADALGDIGGFGVGTDLQWELIGRVGYRFSDGVSGSVGYRHLSLDVNSGSLDMKAQLTGPFVAFDFNF